MKKSDLKTGMIVQTRRGDRFLVMCDPNAEGRELIDFNGGYVSLASYDEDLRLKSMFFKDDFTIDKIYSAGNTIAHLLKDTDRMELKLIWERPKPILDEVEKEYLCAVIKPFRKRVQDISKHSIMPRQEYIRIRYDDKAWGKTTIVLPTFHCGTMYKGMESGKQYTLEELGL